MPTKPSRLPLIPLSPLTQASIESAKCLSKINQNLSEIPDDTVLQKYLSSTREKLDQVTKTIQSIQASSFSDFDHQEIAEEIAFIDSQLFRLVILDPTWLKNFDKRVNAVPLLDFHRYLSHIFAHEIMNSTNNNMISKLIQIAITLLFTYRDFSGCTAILECLQMPEVQRVENAWHQCPPKMIKAFKSLLPILSPEGDYLEYRETLGSLTKDFLQPTHHPRSRMVAVPFLFAHLRTPIPLSIINFCQQRSQVEPFSQKQGLIKGTVDLDQLQTNPSIYHWIVSRAYLTRSQLYQESLQVVPLTPGEASLDEVEQEDLYWEFYPVEIVDLQSSPVASANDSYQQVSDGEQNDLEDYILDDAESIEAVMVTREETSSLKDTDRLSRKEYVPNLNLDEFDSSQPDILPSENTEETREVELMETEIKPTLSATAAEFVPIVHTAVPEDDEVWTGYPVNQITKGNDEDEDEVWTGYPCSGTTKENMEDEDEEWTGYPVSDVEEEEGSKSHPPPKQQTEGWKPSFKPWDKFGQSPTIGKIATGHIQQSFSSNIVTGVVKKNLPPLFASTSAST